MSQNMIVFTMTKNTGERTAKIICLVLPSSQKKDLLTESVLEAVASVVENSLYCRLSIEQSPSRCCGSSVDDVHLLLQ